MRSLCSLFVLLATTSLFADEVGMPPGITKEKAAEGWIALFDGETTYSLKLSSGAKLEKGQLVLPPGSSVETTTHFATFEIEMTYFVEGNAGAFQFHHGGRVNERNAESRGAGKPFPFQFQLKSSRSQLSSPIKIVATTGTTLTIKSLVLKPLGGEPIFNGKDLTGWKEIPGKKSVYSVTSAGELNVKDGNGDIQTEGQWADFVLQLDVISNGDHLNSGVFFRCQPGQFWSGYEAQVRNEWETTVTLNDGTTFTGSYTEKGAQVEMKVGKETKKFAKTDIAKKVDHRDKPIDFGSGGIYHYTKARRVVSSDREYFTMTVIAHSNHIAVWVNGYLTAEYTDTRAANASARRGRKDGPGPISLQGHDPTTDLSFKNIRLAPLPKSAP